MAALTAKYKQINNFDFIDVYDIGILLAQLECQCYHEGVFKIRREKENANKELTKKIFDLSCTNIFPNNKPINAVLFPELSLSQKSISQLINDLNTNNEIRNKFYYCGVEQLTKEEFLTFSDNFENKDDFNAEILGETTRFVNTSVLLIKDRERKLHKFIIPKIGNSSHEQLEQYESTIVYLFKIGRYHVLFSICSDLIVKRNGVPIYQCIIESLNSIPPQQEIISLDIIFHIEQNAYPLGLYNHPQLLQDLREKRLSKQIDTKDTIICAVNSAYSEGKYGYSNLSVMNRGKDSNEMKQQISEQYFAWHSKKFIGGNNNVKFNYVTWHLNNAGLISFILNTNNIEHTNVNPWCPIKDPVIYNVNENVVTPFGSQIPETFVLNQLLDDAFTQLIRNKFQRPHLEKIFNTLHSYGAIINRLFVVRPVSLIKGLFALYEKNEKLLNCDHWHSNPAPLWNLMMCIKIINYIDNVTMNNDGKLIFQNNWVMIIDCKNKKDHVIFEKEIIENIIDNTRDSHIVVFQQLTLERLWNGHYSTFENARRKIVIDKHTKETVEEEPRITQYSMPKFYSIEHFIAGLDSSDTIQNEAHIKEYLDAIF